MGAIIAFCRGFRLGIYVQRTVGASLAARLAADTAAGIEINDAVVPLVKRLDRADIHTGRLLAMVAAQDGKVTASVGEAPFFDILDPGAVHSEGHLVLGFAGYRACMTADALSCVNDKTIVHGQDFSNYLALPGQQTIHWKPTDHSASRRLSVCRNPCRPLTTVTGRAGHRNIAWLD